MRTAFLDILGFARRRRAARLARLLCYGIALAFLSTATSRADETAINFATSPAHPVDSYHVTEFAWGCSSPAAAAEMAQRVENRKAENALLRAESGSKLTTADIAETNRAEALNCVPLLPKSAFALERRDSKPIFRSWIDALGFDHVAVLGGIIVPDGGVWKFWVPVGIVENAQSFKPLMP